MSINVSNNILRETSPTPWEFCSHALGVLLPRFGSLLPRLGRRRVIIVKQFSCRVFQYQRTWYFQYQGLVLRVPKLGSRIPSRGTRIPSRGTRVPGRGTRFSQGVDYCFCLFQLTQGSADEPANADAFARN